ncbi:MAG: hypothetical protein J0651_02405, partial [Actinobacteria bacterium]|nr:hypothetical protein [Actinomycetota bacterium]
FALGIRILSTLIKLMLPGVRGLVPLGTLNFDKGACCFAHLSVELRLCESSNMSRCIVILAVGVF